MTRDVRFHRLCGSTRTGERPRYRVLRWALDGALARAAIRFNLGDRAEAIAEAEWLNAMVGAVERGRVWYSVQEYDAGVRPEDQPFPAWGDEAPERQ